jgi:hypothetical protein
VNGERGTVALLLHLDREPSFLIADACVLALSFGSLWLVRPCLLLIQMCLQEVDERHRSRIHHISKRTWKAILPVLRGWHQTFVPGTMLFSEAGNAELTHSWGKPWHQSILICHVWSCVATQMLRTWFVVKLDKLQPNYRRRQLPCEWYVFCCKRNWRIWY